MKIVKGLLGIVLLFVIAFVVGYFVHTGLNL